METKVTYEEIIKKHRFDSYEEEVSYIRRLMDEGKIRPVKSAGTNGKKPALPLKYWLTVEKEMEADEEKALLDELQFKLPVIMDIRFYIKHLTLYREERKEVLMLSRYLNECRDRLSVCISENERSYDIWGQEKFLSKGSGRTILKHCGIDPTQLNYYETSEPLAYYTDTKRTPQNILIIENLDTFYSVRKKLLQGDKRILGREIGTVIYGGGKRIARAFEDFAICTEPYMREEGNRFLYFGDLDYEGIGIYESFAKRYEKKVEILPFCEGYLAMLLRAGKPDTLQMTKEGQNKTEGERFYSYFDKKIVNKIKLILENDRYIPQEILTLMDL